MKMLEMMINGHHKVISMDGGGHSWREETKSCIGGAMSSGVKNHIESQDLESNEMLLLRNKELRKVV